MLDVKSAVDDKLSLLHFVVQEFENNNSAVANLAEEFPTLEAASRGKSSFLCWIRDRALWIYFYWLNTIRKYDYVGWWLEQAERRILQVRRNSQKPELRSKIQRGCFRILINLI